MRKNHQDEGPRAGSSPARSGTAPEASAAGALSGGRFAAITVASNRSGLLPPVLEGRRGRVLLVAPDSLLPNLALMKLSTWFKQHGHEVGLHVGDPDLICVSVIFERNRHVVRSIATLYPGVPILAGGPGYDALLRLPAEVEACPPDQALWPRSHWAVGRVTAGCCRACHFCVVPRAEPGGARFVQDPAHIWVEGRVLRLIDDNILAVPGAFELVHAFCLARDVELHQEYFDIRLVDVHIAQLISELRHETGVWFSFDLTAYESAVRRGVELLEAAGARQLRALLYIHNERCLSDARHRWDVLRELGVEPFIMVNLDERTPRLRRIQRRGCRPAIWRNLSSAEVFA